MKRILWVLLLVLMLPGCGRDAALKAANTAVEHAVVVNNAAVATLNEVQARQRAARHAAMMKVAETATSKAAGEKGIEAVDARYKPIFDILRKAEAVDRLLGDALVTAQDAIKMGQEPDVSGLLALAADVQSAYNDVVNAIQAFKGAE